ncbi:MAG TPA: response regulator [Terriglobia bacterium]|nr:response regulator [Terriglobia bacterium]
MRKILFVDDDPNILHGLQRTLPFQRDDWEVAFAQGGEVALAMLDAAPFDVVVSDMRMPGMDGAALLACVREKYPETIRFILSGHSDLNAAFRAVPVAHQFLGKPCESGALQLAIERACGLKAVLSDPALCRTIGSMRELPAMPRTYLDLTKALENADASLDNVARIVEQDIAVTAKLLQLVNSAFFGLSREVTNIRTAVSYLGIDVLKSLVLSIGVFRSFDDAGTVQGFSAVRFQTHAFLTAKIAEGLPTPAHLKDATSLAALLHDVGKLVLAARMPAHFTRVLAMADEQGRPLYEVEQDLMGVTHAEIGAYLLGLWGLPWPVVEAVAHHHVPGRVPEQGLDALAAVHIANILAAECAAASIPDAELIQPALDPEYLDSLGVSDQLTEWRSAAQEISRSLSATANVRH